ncbi:TetR/AcrR family transcriptional regulator [Ilumatobacter nonamiensis]|uniref:TetR/AcrR family transcriptional regulator n=1 Tax=Ilumatobacter nonamiensis TaxID=467093 RepID=UPI0006882485|nr:TetR/AcrR family transcriptional regulator [Ilumatobacter nonamiensis]
MGERRSDAKRRRILDAAFEHFLARGVAATSLEQVAETAGVSRQTIYAHFGGDSTTGGAKDTLFVAMVEDQVGRDDDEPHPLVATIPWTDDLERDLATYAHHHLTLVMTPELIRLRRTILGEAERFPLLAATWFDQGPRRSIEMFADWFETLDDRGVLRAPEPMLAAETFNWLVLSTPLNEAMSLPDATTSRDLTRYADEAVRVFLAAYRS